MMTDVNRSFDEVFAEIAEVRRRLDELPSDAFVERVDLRRRLDELQVEIDPHGHDWDQDRSTEDLLAELRALRSRLRQLESQKTNVAAQQGDGTQAAGGGDGWRAVRLLLVSFAGLAVAVAGWWLFVRPASVKFPAAPSAMSWTRVADADFTQGQIFDLVEFGSDVVAVGGSFPEGSGVVWMSPNGSDWERVANGAAFARAAGALRSVARLGSGLIAVSSNDFSPLWSSPDGRTWTPVDYQEASYVGPSRRSMVSVASFGSGVVVGGAEWLGGSEADRDAAVWLTPDAATILSRVPRNDAVFGGEGDQGIDDATEVDGGIVAVGSATPPGGTTDAAVWFSPDGTTWSRVEADAFGGPGVQGMAAVTSFRGGVVAVGSAVTGTDLDAAAWYSPDGTTWSRVEDAAGVFGGVGIQWMFDVTAYGSGVVAVGFDDPTGGDFSDATPAVWYSSDGLTWTRSPVRQTGLDDVGSAMSAVVADDARLVAGGSSITDGSADATVWIGTYVGK